MKLSELKEGEKGFIVKVKGYGSFKKRIGEMGFIKGKMVEVIKSAPLKDPIEYKIMHYRVSLRKKEAELVEVVKDEEQIAPSIFNGTIEQEILKQSVKEKSQHIHVALVGNPNAGKTTFFNQASGSSERVGNYAGVTVSVKNARFRHHDYQIHIADLPGTYSITAYSPEELYVRDYILNEKPDIVINILDASNLERNLYLTSQLIDLDIKVVVALNMYDELKKQHAEFDYEKLGRMIGIPIIPTISTRGNGLTQLLDELIEVYEDREPILKHIHINYGKPVEAAIKELQDEIRKDANLTSFASPRFLALKLLEDDRSITQKLHENGANSLLLELAQKHRSTIESALHDDIDTILTDAHYGFIAGALKQTYKESKKERHRTSKLIDSILTNKILGLPIFLAFMYLAFFVTFNLGEYPMLWIESGMNWLGNFISELMPQGSLRDLLVDGIIAGTGGVLVFLPNILILFFFISLMEDTGYMARAVFIMDKLMQKIGLHGRSFIPLVMGFGCNVPAIMATRTLDNRKDRMITMLINPFMSCSARLPVYLLLIGAFFPENPTLMLFLMYGIGILLAIVFARIFRKTLFKSADVPFVMELPPYRMPTLRSTLKHMWSKGVHYLKKVAGVILAASIIVWALGYYPRTIEYETNYEQLAANTRANFEQQMALSSTNAQKQILEQQLATELAHIKYTKDEEHLSKTYIGRIGKTIAPVIRPLGFDWKMGIGILTGLAAKEVVVSTMGVLYQQGAEANEEDTKLIKQLQDARHTEAAQNGEKVFSPLVAFVFMLFVLIYFPCVGVLGVVAKESNWKWALFLAFYTTALAYLLSFLVFQMGSLCWFL